MKATYETMGGKRRQNGDDLLPNFEMPKCPTVGAWGERHCNLCPAYEHKAFLDGLQYGAH